MRQVADRSHQDIRHLVGLAISLRLGLNTRHMDRARRECLHRHDTGYALDVQLNTR
jgi:hypothetical protein